MDIGLDLKPPPARGRPAKPLHVTKTRDLDTSDIQTLWESPNKGGKSGQVLKIRHTHHLLARLIAEGRKHIEVSAITGYSQSYISTIQHDPAFQELVAYYKGQVQATFVSVHERMAALSMLSAEELQDRLSTDPGEFTVRELHELLILSADRTGHGPQSRNVNLNVNVDLADRLKNARTRSGLGESVASSNSLSGPEATTVPSLRATEEIIMKELSTENLFEKE